MTVEGTNIRIPKKGVTSHDGSAFASHKYAGKSALRYELDVDILAGNLMWIQGPHCDNIHSWISLSGDLAFSHQDGIYGLNSQKGFWRSLPEISLFCQS
jgi:hypothetical protein